jgi:hypothetical protein
MISTGEFRKSTFSGNGGCVEVRRLGNGSVAVRDSKDPRKPAHEFTPQEWVAFLAGVRNGEFDLSG